MNNFLQENLFTIIFFLLLIILLLIGVIGIVIIKLLLSSKEVKTPQTPAQTPAQTPVVTNSPVKIEEEKVSEKYFCENHPDIPSVGSCLICEDVFCDQCLIEHEGLYFCKEHFKVFANNKWKQITDIRTTPETPEEGHYIYNYKRYLWNEKKIPSYVLTHYKINIEEDFIESFIQLNVLEESSASLLSGLEKFKAKH